VVELKGTHGTCATFANEIKKHGFTIGGGRRGSGVYFWGYSSTLRDYATSLAKAWWSYAQSNGQYSSAENKTCEVLYVKIETEDNSFLDLEQHDMKQRLSRFLNDNYKRIVQLNSEQLAIKLYDLFVKTIEGELNTKFKAVHVSVNPPKLQFFESPGRIPHFELMGMPSCYVVKDIKCILSVES
jgi:hypothetical protein